MTRASGDVSGLGIHSSSFRDAPPRADLDESTVPVPGTLPPDEAARIPVASGDEVIDAANAARRDDLDHARRSPG